MAGTTYQHTPRRVTDKQRVRLFQAAGGCCCTCGHKIRSGEVWHLDHLIALVNGGTNDDENLQVLCRNCHTPKTRADAALAADGRDKAVAHVIPKRQRQKSRQGFRGWRRFDGTVVFKRRDDE